MILFLHLLSGKSISAFVLEIKFLEAIIMLSIPLDDFVIYDCFVFAVLKIKSSAVHKLHKHSTTGPQNSPLFMFCFYIFIYLFTYSLYECFVHEQHTCLVSREARKMYHTPLR